MTWADIGDILAREWKRFEKYRPELTHETLKHLRESERYTETEVESYCSGHPWNDLDDDVKTDLFLRFDCASTYVAEQNPKEVIQGTKSAVLYFLLNKLWYDVGLPSVLQAVIGESEED